MKYIIAIKESSYRYYEEHFDDNNEEGGVLRRLEGTYREDAVTNRSGEVVDQALVEVDFDAAPADFSKTQESFVDGYANESGEDGTKNYFTTDAKLWNPATSDFINVLRKFKFSSSNQFFIPANQEQLATLADHFPQTLGLNNDAARDAFVAGQTDAAPQYPDNAGLYRVTLKFDLGEPSEVQRQELASFADSLASTDPAVIGPDFATLVELSKEYPATAVADNGPGALERAADWAWSWVPEIGGAEETEDAPAQAIQFKPMYQVGDNSNESIVSTELMDAYADKTTYGDQTLREVLNGNYFDGDSAWEYIQGNYIGDEGVYEAFLRDDGVSLWELSKVRASVTSYNQAWFAPTTRIPFVPSPYSDYYKTDAQTVETLQLAISQTIEHFSKATTTTFQMNQVQTPDVEGPLNVKAEITPDTIVLHVTGANGDTSVFTHTANDNEAGTSAYAANLDHNDLELDMLTDVKTIHEKLITALTSSDSGVSDEVRAAFAENGALHGIRFIEDSEAAGHNEG